MKIQINGKETLLENEGMTIASLLDSKEIKQAGTAVAVNDELIARDTWETATFSDGDSVTIISAAFGG